MSHPNDAQVAKAARRHAAEYLADALAFEAGGRPAEADRAFEDALNAERWAVFYETRATSGRTVAAYRALVAQGEKP